MRVFLILFLKKLNGKNSLDNTVIIRRLFLVAFSYDGNRFGSLY